VIGSSQQGFTKQKSRLTNLKTLYGDVAASVVKGRAVDIVYLDFSRAFDAVCHNNSTDKLMKWGLDE